MGPEVINRNKDSIFQGDYAGRDLNITNIIMQEDSEREFIVTHNANIKPVSYFTGRERELEDLRQRIEEKRKSVLVSGMGGIGKTHICRKLFEEYSNRHAEDGNGPFRHIGYVEYDGNMDGSLQRCLKYKEQDSPEKNREAAWRELEYLASDGKLLLFVDNVNVSIREDTGLERLKQIPGTVVLTSRRTSFSKEFEPYKIGFLSTKQCKVIYERIRYEDSGKKVLEEEVPDLKYVIEEMAAGHTITIEFLAHLAETKRWTVKELRDELESKGFRLEYRDEEDKLINIQEEYEKLYDLSKLTEAEQNIMEAFSIFPYIPLSAEICNQWLLSDAGVSEDDDTLVGLYRKGWLQFDNEQESYSMHPVFSQFIFEKFQPKWKKHHGLVEECPKYLNVRESRSVLACQRYLPFAESILEKIDMGKSKELIAFMGSIGCLLLYMEEYGESKKVYKKCLELCKEVLGERHFCTAKSYNNLAAVYASQGEHGKAKELYRKSLQTFEKISVWKPSYIATIYNNMAGTYVSEGEYGKAKELYRKSLRNFEEVLGKDHPDTVMISYNLAGVYARQKEYKMAEELYVKGLSNLKRVLGDEHPDIATCYSDLAWVYKNQNRYEEAEELYVKSLRICERVFGEEHPNTAKSYYNLAINYYLQEKYKIALSYFLKSYKTYLKKLGINHPDTQMVYAILMTLYGV